MNKAEITTSPVRLPNTLIIGGPKCGTTSLFDWLAAHPEVCPSTIKETYYFMDSDNPMLRSRPSYAINSKPDNIHDHGLSRVSQFFKDCSPDATIFLEATPHYLYQKTTPLYFSKVNPQPNIFILIRKPSSRILSHFNYSQNNLLRIDPSISFQEFTDALLDKNIEKIKGKISDQQAYFWLKNQLKYSQYYEHIKNWTLQFNPNKVMILMFEDMIANPQSHLKEVSQKLQINPDFYDQFDFSIKNKTAEIQNKKLRRVLRISKQRLAKVAPNIPGFTLLEQQLKSVLLKAPSKSVSKSTIDLDSLHRLDHYFRPHNQKLIDELGLDLACWNQGSATL